MYASYESVKNKKGLKIENNNKIIKIIRPLTNLSIPSPPHINPLYTPVGRLSALKQMQNLGRILDTKHSCSRIQ